MANATRRRRATGKPAPRGDGERSLLDAIASGRLDDQAATVRLDHPVGRFESGRVRCPPLAPEKLG